MNGPIQSTGKVFARLARAFELSLRGEVAGDDFPKRSCRRQELLGFDLVQMGFESEHRGFRPELHSGGTRQLAAIDGGGKGFEREKFIAENDAGLEVPQAQIVELHRTDGNIAGHGNGLAGAIPRSKPGLHFDVR